MRAELNTIEIPPSTVFTGISAAAQIDPMRRLFEGGAYSSNYYNCQLKSFLHLEQIVITFRILLQNVITFRTLLHLGSFITFRPSTDYIQKFMPVTDLLVGGGSYRLHRNRREASKLVVLHGATRFQLALVSQWTVATILGLHSRDGTGR